MSKETFDPKCGFCGKGPSAENQLILGMTAYICGSCVEECFAVVEENKLVENKKGSKKKGVKIDKPTPSQIKAHLDQYVVGQDDAKKILSVSIYNHYKRVGQDSSTDILKSNVLLIGPTGSGKTFLVETIAKFLQVPFAVSDATTMTEAGYVGEDVESVLVRLVQNANGDIKKAERGIVYIDEIDKVACSGEARGRDISGEGVQQGLLKMLEGSQVTINPDGRKSSMSPTAVIDTKNILFICGGAFSGITDNRNKKQPLGLVKPKEDDKEKKAPKLRSKDIVKYGMIPEFVGRFGVIAQLEPLTLESLVKILTEPKNALTKQYQELLAMDGVKLRFDDEFLKEVARRADAEGTGARGLRAILEPALTELMFKIPDEDKEEVVVTTEYLKE